MNIRISSLFLVFTFFCQTTQSYAQENNGHYIENENITLYNEYKTKLNNLAFEIQQNEIDSDQKSRLIQLQLHSKLLNKHIQKISSTQYTYRFLHSIYLSSIDLQHQIDGLLAITKEDLVHLNEIRNELSEIKNNNNINDHFIGKFVFFKFELLKQLHHTDSSLNAINAYYVNFEYDLLRLQSHALFQSQKIKKLIETDYHLMSSRSIDKKPVSLLEAITITFNLKKDLVQFFLANRISIIIWLLICFTISFTIHVFLKKHITPFYRNQPVSLYLLSNFEKQTTLFFLLNFSVIAHLFFRNSPWIIGEFILLMAIVFWNIIIAKSKLHKLLKISSVFLSLSFLFIAIYNVLIVHFIGERLFFVIIHLLLFTSGILFLKVQKELKLPRFSFFTVFWILVLLYQFFSMTLYFLGYTNLERYLVSGLLHLILSFQLGLVLIQSNQQFIVAYRSYLFKRLPAYFENEIENIGKILRAIVMFLIFLSFSKIVLGAYNVDFTIRNLFERLIYTEINLNGNSLSIAWLIITCLILFFSFIFAKIISFYLDYYSNQFYKRNFSFKALIKLIIYFYALYIFFVFSKLELNKITILISAIGFGIGFGLQSVIGNLIAGMVLLVERKIKIDDRIDVEGKRGVVKDIGGRAVRVYSDDGTDLLIPSMEFITKGVRNWNLGDTKNRTELKFKINLKANFEKAIELIDEVIQNTDSVNKLRSINTVLISIENSGAQISTFFWFENKVVEMEEISLILLNIHKAFIANNIEYSELPFLQTISK